MLYVFAEKILISIINIKWRTYRSKIVEIHSAFWDANVEAVAYISFDLRLFDIVGPEFHLSRYLLIVALYFMLTACKRDQPRLS